jgi:hypothetical protein
MKASNLLKPMFGLKIAKRWQAVLMCAFLLALFWLIRYRYSGQFGLYEDDLSIIPVAIRMSFSELMQFIGSYIIHLEGQSRPLHHSLIYFFSWVGWRLDGMTGLYIIGFVIESVNICLFYALVTRLSNLRLSALVTLAYVLYSADLTQSYLTLSMGVHPSITLLLLSFHCYLSKRRVLSYLLAFTILFGYETPFPLFFVVPLLDPGTWNKSLWKRMLAHVLIVSAMLIGVILFRAYMSDTRVGTATLPVLLSTAWKNIWVGPYMNFVAYLMRVVDTFKNLKVPGVTIFSIGGFMLVAGFLTFIPDDQVPGSGKPATLSGIFLSEETALIRLALAGLALLVFSYTMIFTTPPEYLYGRVTRAHLSAGIGASLISGIAVYGLLELFKKLHARLAGIALTAALFAPLIGFSFLLQSDYIYAWRSQQHFWTALLPLISDARPGEVILVEPGIFNNPAMLDSAYIEANTWNVPRVLDKLYQYPTGLGDPPRVFRLRRGWEALILEADGTLNLDNETVYAPRSSFRKTDQAHVIFIQNNNLNMERVDKVAGINGKTIQAKPFDPAAGSAYPESDFYRFMILSVP